jgi:hypothetical protein
MLLQGRGAVRVRVVAGSESDVRKGAPRIILLHGIDGYLEKTWTRSEIQSEWYKKIASSFGAIVCAIEYDSTKFSRRSTEVKIELYSEQIIDAIIQSDVLSGPSIFICHSYGGLLLKRALCDSFLLDKERYFANRRGNIRGVVFLGTPHAGSRIARYIWPAAKLLGIATHGLGDLRWNSRTISALSRDFRRYRDQYTNLQIVNVREMKGIALATYAPTWLIQRFPLLKRIRLFKIVSQESARAGLTDEINLDAACDHYELTAFEYQGVELILERLTECIRQAFVPDEDAAFFSRLLRGPNALGT